MAKKIRLQASENAAPGFPGFVAWLAAVHPKLYNNVLVSDPDMLMTIEQSRHSAAVLQGLPRSGWGLGLTAPVGEQTDTPAHVIDTFGSAPKGDMLQQFAQTVVAAGQAILPMVQQQKILKLQLQRAQAGLRPLDVGAYIDPNSGFNVGMTPATQKTVMLIAGGLGLTWLLPKLFGRR